MFQLKPRSGRGVSHHTLLIWASLVYLVWYDTASTTPSSLVYLVAALVQGSEMSPG